MQRSPSEKWAERPSPAWTRTDLERDPWTARLRSAPPAAAAARRALDPLGPHVGPERMESLRLLATELVTNAVMHAGPGWIDLDSRLFPDAVIVHVADEGEGFDPLLLAGSRPGVPGGRGLELVALLADHVGIDCRRPFRVWFAVGR